MNPFLYICTFISVASCTFVGASQNAPRTTTGWVFLVVGSLGAGAGAVAALLINPKKPEP